MYESSFVPLLWIIWQMIEKMFVLLTWKPYLTKKGICFGFYFSFLVLFTVDIYSVNLRYVLSATPWINLIQTGEMKFFFNFLQMKSIVAYLSNKATACSWQHKMYFWVSIFIMTTKQHPVANCLSNIQRKHLHSSTDAQCFSYYVDIYFL